jgi:hypothetical protein
MQEALEERGHMLTAPPHHDPHLQVVGGACVPASVPLFLPAHVSQMVVDFSRMHIYPPTPSNILIYPHPNKTNTMAAAVLLGGRQGVRLGGGHAAKVRPLIPLHGRVRASFSF